MTTQPLGMGYAPIDNDYFFKGALDEVTIYDGALMIQKLLLCIMISPNLR